MTATHGQYLALNKDWLSCLFVYLSVGLFVSSITQEVTGAFGWNFQGKVRLGSA